MSHIPLKSKEQSMEWRQTRCLPPPPKHNYKKKNHLHSILWYKKGCWWLSFCVNPERYCEVLSNSNEEGKLHSLQWSYFDSWQCSTCVVCATHFFWEKWKHPLYSSNFMLRDYHLFLHLKQSLAGQLYDNFKNAVQQ